MKYPNYTAKKIYTLLFLLTAMFACKKKSQKITCNTAQPFQIAYNGSPVPYVNAVPGDTINFQLGLINQGPKYSSYTYEPNALTGCTILWNFGDGNKSTAQSPDHVYDSDGTYIVLVTLNDDPTDTLSLPIRLGPSPVYTQIIAGTRQWKHSHIVTNGVTQISDTTISDTTITISMINKNSILIDPVKLNYMPAGSTSNTFVYMSAGDKPSYELYFNRISNQIQITIVYGWWLTDIFVNM